MSSFSALLKKFPKEQQAAIMKTIEAAEAIVPHAKRTIAWGMPTLKIGEDNLCHVMGFKNHNSLFPSSGSIATQFKKDLAKFQVSKGTIQFDLNKPFPKPLLKKLLQARIDQINESYPKKSGQHIQYYKTGALRSTGRFKNGKEHGTFECFRSDGTVMRRRTFKNGLPFGTWLSFNAKGKVSKKVEY